MVMSSSFSPGATHFITTLPKRTEKYLGAVAMGLWILRPSYLDACKAAGTWIDEEAFEWRELDENSVIDGQSICRLRMEGGKVFAGARYAIRNIDIGILFILRIVLVGSLTPSAEKWERIITAAGGQVAITKCRLSVGVRTLVERDGGEAGFRLCILPDQASQRGKTALVKYCEQWGYVCVSSNYVGMDEWMN